MFRTKTAFVIGAGANAGIGLPTGVGLKGQIGEALNFYFESSGLRSGDHLIWEAIRQRAREKNIRDPNVFRIASQRVRQGMPLATSIDTYLDTHRDDQEMTYCGKLGIARCISAAESRTPMVVAEDGTIAWSRLAEGGKWYLDLWRLMQEGIPPEKAGEVFDNVSFVVFNYDRCLEVFFAACLKTYYHLSDAEVLTIMSKAPIVHPYGALGIPQGHPGTGFGDSQPDLNRMANELRIYTEQTDDPVLRGQIKVIMSKARRVIFLGFGYHDQNIDLLSHEPDGPKAIMGTSQGISPRDQDVIIRSISTAFTGGKEVGMSFDLSNQTCEGLLHAWWRNLTC